MSDSPFAPVAPLGRTDLTHRRPLDVDRFWFGCCYYPEHWDAATRENDARRMAEAGMNVVRIAEFAWDLMEPEEGQFDFSLFDETIAHLGKHGIETILCTPTATPPRWLTLKHPEILRQDASGTPLSHGSRQHCDYGHPVFRQYSHRITQAMVDHYRDNPHVVGWQTDNEIYCHFADDHSPATEANFQNWLRQKYGDIDRLNTAWGTAFWAQTYRNFSDIPTPKDMRPTYLNPGHQLDYFRYRSDIVAYFQHDQVEIIRAANPKWFVFHNGAMQSTDYRGLFVKDLDFFGFDVYPFFVSEPETRNASHAFNLDRTRSYSGNFIVPEHQCGPGAQNHYSIASPEPGEVRLITYRSIARGADSLLYFRWRSCRFGAEQYWRGILEHDNVPRKRYDEVAQIGRELKEVGPAVLGTSVQCDCAVATGDYDVRESHFTYPMSLPKPDSIAEMTHRWLYERGFHPGCIHPTDDLSGIQLYFMTHWALFDPTWLEPLENWVKQGGVLVIGARTGTRTLDNQIVSATPPGVLADLCGVQVIDYGAIKENEGRPRLVRAGDESFEAEVWWEELELAPGTEVLATWDSRHLAGTPAVTVRSVGKGRVVYVATYLGDIPNAFLLPRFCELADLQPHKGTPDPHVEVVTREGPDHTLTFYLNSADAPRMLANVEAGENLLTGESFAGGALDLGPYGVAVLKR